MFSRPVHPSKAKSPMLLIVEGMVTDVMFLAPASAFAPMDVMV
jgi:hypothetical protein